MFVGRWDRSGSARGTERTSNIVARKRCAVLRASGSKEASRYDRPFCRARDISQNMLKNWPYASS